jgi:uncharacterized membrane protein
MLEYLARGWAVCLIGFVPLAEIYVAVPAGLALGLSPASAVGWSVAGNWAPIPLVHLLYEWLRRVPRIREALGRLASERVRARVERGGFWFYLLVTPLVGTWALAAAVKLLGVPPRRFLIPSLLSVLAFGVAIAAAIAAGVELVR